MSIDTTFYKNVDAFFSAPPLCGLTYDDVSLATLYSEILPHQTSLETRLSDTLCLHIPILAADMDTVTESEMAIALALRGGLGVIHYNMPLKRQLKEVARVKNHVHGLIQDPITVSPESTIGEVLECIRTRAFSFRTFPVVNGDGRLAGLLPGRVVRERYQTKTVREAMVPRDHVHTLLEKEIATNPIATADAFFNDHIGIHKLLIVDDEDHLKGLFTLSDIDRITQESPDKMGVKPARDAAFRLICGAALHIPRTVDGRLDTTRLLEHAGHLVDEGVDALAVSTAHGHSRDVGEALRRLRDAFTDMTLIAGNVTSADGVEFLADAGADVVKVGQGPGSICTTRIVAGVGIPQLTALYVGAQAARRKKVTIVADGGIAKSGDIVKALTLADGVMCGGLFAGCREAPGKIVEIEGKLYKQYRGMGSIEAMKAGSAARYGHVQQQKGAAEGIESLKEISGSLDSVLDSLISGVRAGMGYLGAADVPSLKGKAQYIRVTQAGRREAGPHDVVEVKALRTGEGD